MKNEIYDSMLSRYDLTTEQNKRNAVFEVNQHDFAHLAGRCMQFNNEDITPELFKGKLKERLSTADIKQVKEDLLPFVRNPKELDIWSNDYFVQLADMVRIE